jgi:transposase
MVEVLAMNDKERERLKMMARLQEGTITQKSAAKLLSISIRQVKRLYRSYLEFGDIGLTSKRRGKVGNRSLPIALKELIATRIRQVYADFGPTLACEKIVEYEKINISVSAVRNIMIQQGIWLPNKKKAQKIHKLRQCRDCFGELVQLDGSYHDWFEGRFPKCCLLVLIDDATSQLLGLQFVPWESCWAYFNFLKAYLRTYGRPGGLYTDKHAIFETTRKTDLNYKDTQFHRAMEELGIKLILARTPQAKGRVERMNGTLQDRLIKEMRLAGISTMEEANNKFLPAFIKKYNKQFGKIPKSSIDAHRSLDDNHNLERILCLHYTRKITKDLMVYFQGKRLQITEINCHHRLAKRTVIVLEYEKGGCELIYQGQTLAFIDIDKKPSRITAQKTALKPQKSGEKHKPNPDHPWKKWQPHSKKIAFYIQKAE